MLELIAQVIHEEYRRNLVDQPPASDGSGLGGSSDVPWSELDEDLRESNRSQARDIAAKLAAAEREIAATRSQAMTNVAEVAHGAAAAIVERLGGRQADPAAIAAAVNSVKSLGGAA